MRKSLKSQGIAELLQSSNLNFHGRTTLERTTFFSLFQFGLTVAPVQNAGLINAKVWHSRKV